MYNISSYRWEVYLIYIYTYIYIYIYICIYSHKCGVSPAVRTSSVSHCAEARLGHGYLLTTSRTALSAISPTWTPRIAEVLQQTAIHTYIQNDRQTDTLRPKNTSIPSDTHSDSDTDTDTTRHRRRCRHTQ
jgi:hypothetical protein